MLRLASGQKVSRLCDRRIPFVLGASEGVGRRDIGVCLSQTGVAFSEYSVFLHEANFRDYFSMFTFSSSNVVNLPSSLRPIVESGYTSRILLLGIKFFLRNTGDVAVQRMRALFAGVLQRYKDCPGGEGQGGKEGTQEALRAGKGSNCCQSKYQRRSPAP